MNLRKGMFRLCLVLWLIPLIFFVSTSYREVITYLGSDHWSEKAVIERQKDVCKSNQLDVSCVWGDFAPAESVITKEEAGHGMEQALLYGAVIPFGLLCLFYCLVEALYWVYRGFKRRD